MLRIGRTALNASYMVLVNPKLLELVLGGPFQSINPKISNYSAGEKYWERALKFEFLGKIAARFSQKFAENLRVDT